MSTREPTKDELNHLRYYVGRNKPQVDRLPKINDPWLYRRLQSAKKLGITMDKLEDEPDNLPESAEEADWEDINN